MRTLPTPEPQQPTEHTSAYGLRLLRFVVSTGVTATLSHEQLAIADHVYPIAVGHHDILPIAADRLSLARTWILRALADLDSIEPETAATIAPTISPASHDKGRLAPLRPMPIVRPPSGQLVDVGF
jgi:hypothetical protein